MMNPDPSKVYKVWHTIKYQGKYYKMFKTDLHWDDGWYLVIEWQTNHDGEFPAIRHPIDPRLLCPLGEEFLLQAPVEIPEHPAVTEALLRWSNLP